MKAEFTPGPWEAWQAPDGTAVVRCVYRDEQNRRVTSWPATCSCNTLPNMANAHLIAAAPWLYDAAEDTAEALALLRIGLRGNKAAMEVIDAHISELNTALTKARGES
jgi:hypothetical protein